MASRSAAGHDALRAAANIGRTGDSHHLGGGPSTKHKVCGFGPDVTLPVASKSRLFALVNVRYFWETGAEVKTQGQNLLVTATLPIPSVTLT